MMLEDKFTFPKYQGKATAEYLNDDPTTGVVIIRKDTGGIYAMMSEFDFNALRAYGLTQPVR